MEILDLDRLTESADIIVIAVVTEVHAQWEKDHTDIGSIVTIRVSDYLKSTGARPHRLEIHLPGGTPPKFQQRLWHMRVDGLPEFHVSERGMFFLEQRGRRLELVGWAQGSFKVKKTITGQEMVTRDLTGVEFSGGTRRQIPDELTLNRLMSEVKRRLR